VGATVTDSFNDYFMYRPNGGIWVPLGILSWGWNVNAAHAAAQQNRLVGQDGWSYQIVNQAGRGHRACADTRAHMDAKHRGSGWTRCTSWTFAEQQR
jgi:hypothetical protein